MANGGRATKPTPERRVVEYRGIVDNGVIRPTEPIEFPDGTTVAFHEVTNGSERLPVSPGATAWQSSDERFWRGYSIEQLAQEQGVSPFASLDDLGGEWPQEDDLDEFLRSIREWRR
jgi:hypothetical protein